MSHQHNPRIRSTLNQNMEKSNQDMKQLEGEKSKYPTAANQQKLDIAQHFYQIIQAQTAKIQQLEANQLRAQSQSEVSSFQRNISAKFDEIVNRQKQTTFKKIEELTHQKSQLISDISRLKSEKQNVKIQIKLPSFLEKFKGELDQKIGSSAEIQQLRLVNSNLKLDRQKILKQLKDTKQDFDKFSKDMKKDYEDLMNKYDNQKQNNFILEKEINRLKQSEANSSQNLRKKEKQLSQSRSGQKLYFAAVKELLNSMVFLGTPNKLSDYLNTLKGEEFFEESKKRKIKQLIKQNNNRIAEIKSKDQKVNQEKNKLQRQYEVQAEKIDKYSKQLQTSRKIISEMTTNIQSINKQKESLFRIKLENDQRIKQLNINVSKLTSTIQNLERVKKENEATINEKSSQISQLLNTIQANKNTIMGNKDTIEKQITELKELTSKNLSLTKELKQVISQRDGLNIKIRSHQQNILRQSKEIGDKNVRIAALQASEKDLRGQIVKLTNQIGTLRQQLQRNETDLTRVKNNLSVLESNKARLEGDIDSMNRQLGQARQRINDQQTVLDKINKELIGEASHYYLGQSLTIKSITPDKLKDLKPEILTLLSSWKDSFNRVKFFNGSEIITKQNIQFILNALDEFMGCTPFESKLIYKYDPLNLVNFHNYFDRVENLIAFIKLTNGTIIGGFTVYPIDAERIQRPGRGFLFSLTGKKVYNIRSEPKLPVVSYDNYYFIFGNAEIRLKSQEKKVFSNFGIANSTFDNGTDPRTKFLNVFEMTNNELEIDTYEFYRIKFEP